MSKPRVGHRNWDQMTVEEAKKIAEQLKNGPGIGGVQQTHRALTNAGTALKELDFDIRIALQKIGIAWSGGAAELATAVMDRMGKVSADAGNRSQASGASVQNQGQNWADTKNKAPSGDDLTNKATENWFERNVTRPLGFDTDVTAREAQIKEKLKQFGEAMRSYENGSRDRADTGHRPLPEMPVLTAAAPDAPPPPPPPINPGIRDPKRPGGRGGAQGQGNRTQPGGQPPGGQGQLPPGVSPPPTAPPGQNPGPIDGTPPVWDIPGPPPVTQPGPQPPVISPPGQGPGPVSGPPAGIVFAPGGQGGTGGSGGATVGGPGGRAPGAGALGAGGSAGIGSGAAAGGRVAVSGQRPGSPGSLLQPAAPTGGAARGEEDKEHSRKFWQPSDEPFADDRSVAPPVIGE
ncbi:hypothetical protein M8C13_25240 [Crossiella sp. SN42]|uniref:hypothetical protein n=1 Tax=Crossiella sp. SN42 TaxID=2944808 RepID=UPI00207CEAA8|nr:hypothetical protein [Crossiella sp. SN42]MCO1579058.1 hypothetical protein [Crossiella sp. SN42]